MFAIKKEVKYLLHSFHGGSILLINMGRAERFTASTAAIEGMNTAVRAEQAIRQEDPQARFHYGTVDTTRGVVIFELKGGSEPDSKSLAMLNKLAGEEKYVEKFFAEGEQYEIDVVGGGTTIMVHGTHGENPDKIPHPVRQQRAKKPRWRIL